MKHIKFLIFLLLLFIPCRVVFSQEIKVCVNVRGNTGLEDRLKNIISREFRSIDHVVVVEDRSECHLYVDLALVEQEPIRFYGLGVSIAYRIRDQFYSRPTADVAQFGKERMEDVCEYLVREIDKAFLAPLKQPLEKQGPPT